MFWNYLLWKVSLAEISQARWGKRKRKPQKFCIQKCLMRLSRCDWEDHCYWLWSLSQMVSRKGVCVNQLDVQIDALTSLPEHRWFCVDCMPKVSKRAGKQNPLEPPNELQHLEKNNIKTETLLDKSANTLKQWFSTGVPRNLRVPAVQFRGSAASHF